MSYHWNGNPVRGVSRIVPPACYLTDGKEEGSSAFLMKAKTEACPLANMMYAQRDRHSEGHRWTRRSRLHRSCGA